MKSVRLSHSLRWVQMGWWALVIVTYPGLRGQSTWTGNSALTDSWSASANWGGIGTLNTAPSSSTNTALIFAGSNRLTPDMTTDFTAKSLTFAAGAGSLTWGVRPTLP